MASKSDTAQSSNSELLFKECKSMLNYLCGPATDSAQLSAARYFRKLLSSHASESSVVKTVCDPKLVGALVTCLWRWDQPELQLDAAWSLTNIACGDQRDTHKVVRAGAVEPLVKLAQAERGELRDQAVWALSNVAGDCSQCKSLLIRVGFMPVLVGIVRTETHHHTSLSSLKTAVWALSNLCRGRTVPQLKPLVPVLASLLAHPFYAMDSELLGDACWTLAYVADGTQTQVQAVLDTGICGTLVALLGTTNDRLLAGALRAVGNLVTGNDEQTQTVINHDLMPKLFDLLKHEKPAVRREAAWTVSNVTAGTQDQIESVISQEGIIQRLIEALWKDEDKVIKEVVWVLCNATSGGSATQTRSLVSWGVLSALCHAAHKFVPLDARLCSAILAAMDILLDATANARTAHAQLLHHWKIGQLLSGCRQSPLVEEVNAFRQKHLETVKPIKEKQQLIEFHFVRARA